MLTPLGSTHPLYPTTPSAVRPSPSLWVAESPPPRPTPDSHVEVLNPSACEGSSGDRAIAPSLEMFLGHRAGAQSSRWWLLPQKHRSFQSWPNCGPSWPPLPLPLCAQPVATTCKPLKSSVGGHAIPHTPLVLRLALLSTCKVPVHPGRLPQTPPRGARSLGCDSPSLR